MTILKRAIPAAATSAYATPFKLFIPRELEEPAARAIWAALRSDENLLLADPFAMPGVSTVFEGVSYAGEPEYDLSPVANALADLEDELAEELADAWVELWVPDAFEDAAEPLAVDDLTAPPANG